MMGEGYDYSDSDFDVLVIQSKSERGFWNNDLGWVRNITDATQFNRDEIYHIMLPMSSGDDAEFIVVYFGE